MANLPSVEKRNRQSIKRHARNTIVRTKVKSAVKKVREALESKDAAKAGEALKGATKLLDKAATKGVVTKENASRRIGRLSKAVHTLKKAPAAAPAAAPAKGAKAAPAAK
jgi:small subunit ribosomal protein S20